MTVEEFIAYHSRTGGAETANEQRFIFELCELLQLPKPDGTVADESKNNFVFQKAVKFNNGDGTTSDGRIDLYKQNCFVWESKQGADSKIQKLDEPLATVNRQRRFRRGTAPRGTDQWSQAMRAASQQAKRYAEALPEWPPFLIVCDIGFCFDVYADFSGSGKNYQQFPDPQTFRIPLQKWAKPETQEFLKAVWLDPHSLDPTKKTAKVTRELADRLARLAKSLESSSGTASRRPGSKATPAVPKTTEETNSRAEEVAQFLMRCLFTMFAEDVELLPKGSFVGVLESVRSKPGSFVPMMKTLWTEMNNGGFSGILRQEILEFNGGLFEDCTALPLNSDQLELLIEAAKANWADVEPAIFGTLLERALDPVERHKLGAHYTPRAYVERLVIPTIMEPLREEWDNVYATATAFYNAEKVVDAQKIVRDFHDKLCHIRVLDPACGSGNFLYVALELIKKLEGEVTKARADFSDRQGILTTVGPHQFLGIEVNPRAAAIANLVLWIGYLQWHIRALGKETISTPIIRKFDQIECRDAVLARDSIEPVFDDGGKPVTRWDGRTTKTDPITQEEVPEPNAQIQELRYINARKAEWPQADYIVGNPPFVGSARMRDALGNGYTEALRTTFHDLPDSCDFVMYWWWNSARLVGTQKTQQFGFITTNSIKQRFNQRVLAKCLDDKQTPFSIRLAVPDHPWVDSADGADVRIAMTVCGSGIVDGTAYSSSHARPDDVQAFEKCLTGVVRANLTVGPDLNSATPLRSNELLSAEGVKPHGMGFVLTHKEAATLGFDTDQTLSRIIRPYSNGRDIAAKNRDVLIIDLHGHRVDEVRVQYPSVYQHVLTRVKPERDQNNEKSRRENWWLFGRKNTELRAALMGLSRYIVTVKTAKHRYFVFLNEGHVPDSKLIAIALRDAYHFGVLSSRIHVVWSLFTGAHLGVGNDPTYVKSICFDAFAFPESSESAESSVRRLAEQLEAHRKSQQARHPDLTFTGMYNVLEKLRDGDALTEKEKQIHEKGLVSVLKQIHDELDAAVFDAYGWPHDLTDEEILERLVALNHERAEEEKQGLIRWLRPEFQNPSGGKAAVQTELALEDDGEDSDEEVESPTAESGKSKAKGKAKAKSKEKAPAKAAWPKKLPEQITIVRQTLQDHKGPTSSEVIAKRFKSVKPDTVEELLDTLVLIGQARLLPDGRYVM